LGAQVISLAGERVYEVNSAMPTWTPDVDADQLQALMVRVARLKVLEQITLTVGDKISLRFGDGIPHQV
jgi:hypothetical protein